MNILHSFFQGNTREAADSQDSLLRFDCVWFQLPISHGLYQLFTYLNGMPPFFIQCIRLIKYQYIDRDR